MTMTNVPSETTPALEIRSLLKVFAGTTALDKVDLDVRSGEIHGLVGQNGSGKSTLIKILAGFHPPTSYESAHVNGNAFSLGDSAAAHAAGLRFVHQDLGLVDSLSAMDNLALGAGYIMRCGGRISWREQAAGARQLIHRVGASFDVRKPVSQLSAFERTALAIARALQRWSDDVSLLVLDEPTAAMPRTQVEQLFSLVRRVASRGTGVLLVSHHLDEVFAIADRVTVLRDGRVQATRDVTSVDPSQLVQLMTGTTLAASPRSSPARATDEVVLAVRGVEDKQGNLKDFNLDLHRAEIIGVAGLDGSGRESICRLVFGAAPRRGTVEVNGKTLPARRPDLAIGMGIALVPADRHAEGLVMSMNVRENLTMVDLKPFWQGLRLRRRREQRASRDWIGHLGVRTPSSETVIEALSGGNQQKVLLGKWLRISPQVLLLDEPTQGVDVKAQQEVHTLIARAVESGSSAIVCSSDERELAILCGIVIVLTNGSVVARLEGKEISASEIADRVLSAHIPESETYAPETVST
jgi:ribose transport system ATP-binding protein